MQQHEPVPLERHRQQVNHRERRHPAGIAPPWERRQKPGSPCAGSPGDKGPRGRRPGNSGQPTGRSSVHERSPRAIFRPAGPGTMPQRKSPPWVGARLRRVPCATRRWRGLRNPPLRGSDSRRAFSAGFCVARRFTWGAERRRRTAGEKKNRLLRSTSKKSQKRRTSFGHGCFSGPLARR